MKSYNGKRTANIKKLVLNYFSLGLQDEYPVLELINWKKKCSNLIPGYRCFY